jgi:hypothetical protein
MGSKTYNHLVRFPGNSFYRQLGVRSSSSSSNSSSSLVHQSSNLHESLTNVVVATAQTIRGAHSVPIVGVNEDDCAATSSCRGNRYEMSQLGSTMMSITKNIPNNV